MSVVTDGTGRRQQHGAQRRPDLLDADIAVQQPVDEFCAFLPCLPLKAVKHTRPIYVVEIFGHCVKMFCASGPATRVPASVKR
jgi:hypothetical protein